RGHRARMLSSALRHVPSWPCVRWWRTRPCFWCSSFYLLNDCSWTRYGLLPAEQKAPTFGGHRTRPSPPGGRAWPFVPRTRNGPGAYAGPVVEMAVGHRLFSGPLGPGRADARVDLYRTRRGRPHVEVEDRGRKVDRGARVRDVHHAGETSLDRCRTQKQVGLLGAVTELAQVRDRVQAGPLVGGLGVQVALFAVQGHRGSGKSQPIGVGGGGLCRHEDGVLTETVATHEEHHED